MRRPHAVRSPLPLALATALAVAAALLCMTLPTSPARAAREPHKPMILAMDLGTPGGQLDFTVTTKHVTRVRIEYQDRVYLAHSVVWHGYGRRWVALTDHKFVPDHCYRFKITATNGSAADHWHGSLRGDEYC